MREGVGGVHAIYIYDFTHPSHARPICLSTAVPFVTILVMMECNYVEEEREEEEEGRRKEGKSSVWWSSHL